MAFLDRKVLDARGQERVLQGTGFGVSGVADNPGETRARQGFKLARRRLRRNFLNTIGVEPVWVWTIGVYMLLPGLGVAASLMGARFGRELMVMGGMVMFLVGPLAAYYVCTRRGLRAYKKDYVVAAMLAETLCPSCGYDLSATEPGGDGCRVCVECGGAWRPPARACICCAMDLEETGVVLKDGKTCCRRCGQLDLARILGAAGVGAGVPPGPAHPPMSRG